MDPLHRDDSNALERLADGWVSGEGPEFFERIAEGARAGWVAKLCAGVAVRERSRCLEEERLREQLAGLTASLKEAEQRFNAVFEGSPDAIFLMIAEGADAGRIVAANLGAAEQHGYAVEELVGLRIQDLDTPESALEAPNRFARLLVEGHLRFEVEHRRRDGTILPLEVTVSLVTIGGCRYALALDRDITERRNQEAERAFSDALVEDHPGLLILVDGGGRIRRWNRHAERVLRWSPEDIRRMHVLEFVVAEQQERLSAMLTSVLSTGSGMGEVTLSKKDGGAATYLMRASVLSVGGARCVLGVGVDVTERRRVEAEARQSAKMETVGRLAGGVAHDFNNFLQAIQGFATLARGEVESKERRDGYLDEVLRASDRAAEMTQQLLAFGRRQNLRMVPADLREVIRKLLKLLERLIGEHIQLVLVEDPELALVRCDPTQIEQVVMNLCVNSRDAMPEGGRITLELRNRGAGAAPLPAKWSGARKGGVVLSVSDTGKGMPPEILDRIFEPFYTTKEMGKGTGLGLSVVYGIVEQHGGSLRVLNGEPVGTRFEIWLPAEDRAGSGARVGEERGARGMLSGSGTILLAEDEPAVRDLVRLVLEQAGYRVLATTNGEEAVEVFRAECGAIDGCLLDIMMPRLNGMDAYRRMTSICPSVPVLFMSGYSEALATGEGALPERARFLSKPCGPDLILRTLRELLEANRRAGTGIDA